MPGYWLNPWWKQQTIDKKSQGGFIQIGSPYMFSLDGSKDCWGGWMSRSTKGTVKGFMCTFSHLIDLWSVFWIEFRLRFYQQQVKCVYKMLCEFKSSVFSMKCQKTVVKFVSVKFKEKMSKWFNELWTSYLQVCLRMILLSGLSCIYIAFRGENCFAGMSYRTFPVAKSFAPNRTWRGGRLSQIHATPFASRMFKETSCSVV